MTSIARHSHAPSGVTDSLMNSLSFDDKWASAPCRALGFEENALISHQAAKMAEESLSPTMG